MKNLLLVIVLLIISLPVHAQISTDINATGRHKNTIGRVAQTRAQAKATRDQAKARKKMIKDLKEQKKAQLQFKERFEELKEERLQLPFDSLNLPNLPNMDSLKMVHGDSIGQVMFDSLKREHIQIPKLTKEDSIALAKEILYESGFPSKYRKLMENPIKIDSSLLRIRFDSSRFNPAALMPQKWQDYFPNGLGASPDQITQPPADPALGALTSQFGKPNPNLISPDMAKGLINKITPKEFQQMQTDISKQKKKYSEMPDMRDPKAGRKRHSLDGVPFRKRIFLAGAFNAISTDPFILDINLQLGYRINRKSLAGIGLMTKEQLTRRESAKADTQKHGYSLFSRYDLIKSFFLWGETQFQVNRSLGGQTNSEITDWQEAWMLGIGNEFKVGRVLMNTTIMYDFNYLYNTINSRPMVFRLGVQLTRKS